MNTPDMEYARNKLNKTYLRLAYGKSDIQKTKKEVDDILNEIITSRDTYWKEQIKKTKDEWYEVGYREGGDSKRIDIEILKEEWKERVVDSKRFFIAVEEDNITIRPVVRSDLDQILDNLK